MGDPRERREKGDRREGGVIPKEKGACRFHMRGIYYLKCEITVVPPHVSLILVVLLHVWII